MKICVVHNTLNSVGGGERVCLTVIEALKSLDYEVTLITAEPTDWIRVERSIGKVVRPDHEISLLPLCVRAFGVYMRLLTSLKLAKSRGDYDLVINTHGDVLPVTSDILYMHYPTFALIKETPVNKYSKSLFWRLYFTPYEKIQSQLVKKRRWKILLTNSEFSKEAIRKYVGAEAIILYPPVDVNDFLKVSENKNREDKVVLCGRYTPEKNYEFALKVASHLPGVKFIIIGAYSGKVSGAYYSKLTRIKEKLGLNNVKLLKNVSREEQLRIYSKSKVFMHAMINEHFGIAVVEGMAAGLIPIVHKSGGPWLDIVDRGKFGLGYSNISEAVKAIKYALNNYGNLRENALARAALFHKDNFINNFIKVVKEFGN